MAMTPKEMIAVLQHFEAGGDVQVRINGLDNWGDAIQPCWDFAECEYRPKPKPLELWVNVYDDGTIRCAYRDHVLAAEQRGKSGRTVHMIEVQDD